MKKMLIIFLSITLCIGTLSAQAIDGNYTLDSLTVQYVMVTRDMNQQDSDGNTVVAAAAATQLGAVLAAAAVNVSPAGTPG